MVSRIFHAIAAALCGAYLGWVIYLCFAYPDSGFTNGAWAILSLNFLIKLSMPGKEVQNETM